jgi:hypothetical protein
MSSGLRRSGGVRPALGETEEGEENQAAPRQYAFDEVLEQNVGQAEVFDIVAMQPVQSALSGSIGCVLCFGASGAGKDFSLRCERPGQEGLLLRALALVFTGNASTRPPPAAAAPPRARTCTQHRRRAQYRRRAHRRAPPHRTLPTAGCACAWSQRSSRPRRAARVRRRRRAQARQQCSCATC